MEDDNEESAQAQIEKFSDDRIDHSWDKNRLLSQAFLPILNLKGQAWDVYLLYAPGVTWTDEPPRPTFWMHQLPVEAGADGKFLLNPGRFFFELKCLLGKKDANSAWESAFMLHFKGLDFVKADKQSFDEVPEAVYPNEA